MNVKSKKSILVKAVIKILKPLIKVLIRNEVSHSEFSVLAKQAYVETAYEHFSISGKKTTYSRVAVLTGLNRKEIVALVKNKEKSDYDVLKGKPNRAIRVVNGWRTDSEFLNKNNEADVLPIHGEHGSFSALVARYSGDITLGAVIDEFERIGLVFKPDKQSIKLITEGYIPKENELEKIKIMSICVADLLASAVHNQEENTNDNLRFQRQVVYQEVPKHIVKDFKKYSDQKSLFLLRDYNHWLEKKINQSILKPDTATSRVGVGIYYFEEHNKKIEEHNKKKELKQ